MSQRLHHDEIVGGELPAAAFLGQVQVAEHLLPQPHRHAQERPHRRMVRRKAVRIRVLGDVGEPDRVRVADQGAEHTAALREAADPLAGRLVDSGVHELHQGTIRPDHAQRRVLRVRQPRRRLHDVPQRGRQLQAGSHRHHRIQQRVQLITAGRDLGQPLLHLSQQLVQPQSGQGEPDRTRPLPRGARHHLGHPAPPHGPSSSPCPRNPGTAPRQLRLSATFNAPVSAARPKTS